MLKTTSYLVKLAEDAKPEDTILMVNFFLSRFLKNYGRLLVLTLLSHCQVHKIARVSWLFRITSLKWSIWFLVRMFLKQILLLSFFFSTFLDITGSLNRSFPIIVVNFLWNFGLLFVLLCIFSLISPLLTTNSLMAKLSNIFAATALQHKMNGVITCLYVNFPIIIHSISLLVSLPSMPILDLIQIVLLIPLQFFWRIMLRFLQETGRPISNHFKLICSKLKKISKSIMTSRNNIVQILILTIKCG